MAMMKEQVPEREQCYSCGAELTDEEKYTRSGLCQDCDNESDLGYLADLAYDEERDRQAGF